MSVFILAAMLVLQDADAQASAADELETSAAPAPATDAATLIAQIEGRLAAYGDTVSQLAARTARERYLTELLLPVMARTDLDDGARGEILLAISDSIRDTEASNSRWAARQIEPDSFVILWTENARLGESLLRLAERDEDNRRRIVAALEPIAMNGGYDGITFATMADAFAVSEDRPQPYGTATHCVEGVTEIWPLADVGAVDAGRALLGLPALDAGAIGGEACETSTSDAD
ncbi:hypothetical protein [Maricaulis maris]|uniref:hypothetical protein n=1 Tax=Maricaulis maris TaxID=74318 RepID=UPI003B8D605F